MPFSMTLPFPTNTLIISLLCSGIFFSLPTQEFFRGQGKIKVGTETEIMHLISRKLQLDEEALFYNLTMRIINT